MFCLPIEEHAVSYVQTSFWSSLWHSGIFHTSFKVYFYVFFIFVIAIVAEAFLISSYWFLVGWLPTGFGVREAVADSWSRERELGGSLPLLLCSGLPSSGRSWIPVRLWFLAGSPMPTAATLTGLFLGHFHPFHLGW